MGQDVRYDLITDAKSIGVGTETKNLNLRGRIEL